MAEEKIVNEQENTAEEVKNEQTSAQEEAAKQEEKATNDNNDEAAVQLEKLAGELADVKDKHVRLQAEFDNFRKRTLKEKTDLIKSGGESVLKNIIPVVDDFDRAMAAVGEVEDENPLKQGVNLIYTKFQEFLKQNGVTEIDAKDQDFDTDLHEALTKIPAPTEELKGKVVDVIQKGYLLHDKVIRFAKVVIGE